MQIPTKQNHVDSFHVVVEIADVTDAELSI